MALTVTLATFMEVLDTSIANVALPHMAGSLGASPEEATWVLTSYLVASAIILPISGWLMARMGRKRFYMTCVIVFTLCSLLCGIAPTLPFLIFARILQGLGGGGLAPEPRGVAGPGPGVARHALLPGLPLDGGRMLRAVVWKITGRPMSGTIAAAWVGRALAVSVLIGLPLLTQTGALGDTQDHIGGMDTVTDALLAAILAAIIWTGAGNSLRMARLREHLPELRARSLTRRAVPVETDTPLSEALRRANDAGARALVVVDANGEPLSLVREAAIVGVPEHRRPWVAVSGLAQDITDGMRVSAELAGEPLLDALRAAPATEYLVVEDSGEIYGVLSAADVERAFVKAMARPS